MHNRAQWIALAALGAMALGAGFASAADIGVTGKKLIVIDKLVAASKAKVVYVSKDTTAGITKGTASDLNTIDVTFDFNYVGSVLADGQFVVPAGELSGLAGWKVNKDTVAKFVNKDNPEGGVPSGVKVAVIKPGKLLKLVGKTLGDSDINVVAAGAPTGSVCTQYTVDNGGDSNTHCTEFENASCSFKEIAGGSGRKLVCKGGIADGSCSCTGAAAGCGNGVVEGAEECDDGNVDPTDGCTNECTECGNNVVAGSETCDDGNLIDGDGCDSNCQPTGCGNGLIVAPETCDDGNTVDGDNCPANCIIEACQPIDGSDRTVAVDFGSGGGSNVAGLTLLVDYPEGKVSIPGSGAAVPGGIITDLPGFALGQTNDLDYAVRQVIADTFTFPDGLAFNIHFEDCDGASAPVDADFSCTVEGASDANGDPVGGVTCSVDAP
jgi:cysteine-rich repeat protein